MTQKNTVLTKCINLQHLIKFRNSDGRKNFHSLSEQLATLFPGQLIVERSGGLVFIGLIWRRGGHKSTKSAALV